MTHQQFLKDKDKLAEILEKAMFKVLSEMSIEDIKKIDWFNSSNYDNIPTIEK